MAVDIGAEAIDRPSSSISGRTAINKGNPASIGGIITSIDVWANVDMTGFRVGTFYVVSGNTLKCRASQAIAGTITAGSKVTKTVSIEVEIGDYIGYYYSGGRIEISDSGYAGRWYGVGEHIDPDDEFLYDLLAGQAISLGGYISPVGWAGGNVSSVAIGTIAKINGIPLVNIAKVSGIA